MKNNNRDLSFTWISSFVLLIVSAIAFPLPLSAQTTETIFTTETPGVPDATDGTSYELGMKFVSAKAGYITAIRYWKAQSETGIHDGRIWDASGGGAPLATVTFSGETASGWQQQALDVPLPIEPNTTYVVSVNANSHFALTGGGLASAIINGNLSSVADGTNGVFGNPGSMPTGSYQNGNYFRDVAFVAGSTISKIGGDNQTAALGTILSEPLVVEVRDEDGNPLVGTSVDFAVSGGDGSVSPTSAVTDGNGEASTFLTLGVTPGINSVSAVAADVGSVSFTATGEEDYTGIEQTVFTSETPSNEDASDGGASYELGMKFQSDAAGYVTAIRYWKAPSEAGTHDGRIWDAASGTPLATVTFTGETTSGWQQQSLETPLAILPDTAYVVSVNTNSHYAFTDSGLAAPIVNRDLSSVADGNNGVYGNPGSFPSGSYQDSNYFRDLVLVSGPTIAVVSGNNQNDLLQTVLSQPLVVEVRDIDGNPLAGTTVDFTVTAGGGSVSPASAVTDGSGRASTSLTLGDVAGINTVSAVAEGAGSVDFTATAEIDPASATRLILTPASAGTSAYVPVTLEATILDDVGNIVTRAANPVTFSITSVSGSFIPSPTVTPTNGKASVSFVPTAPGNGTVTASATGLTDGTSTLTVTPQTSQTVFTDQTPSNPNATDGAAYELGMKFRSNRGGYIKAIRYWKATSESGNHEGRIWSTTGGTPLASVTFVDETASGWQEQVLDTPLAIQPNVTYVVSVGANNFFAVTSSGLQSAVVNGDLSSLADGNNGVFGSPGAFPTGSYQNSNYFRDVLFVVGPTIAKSSGDNQSAAVGTDANPLVVTVRDVAGNPVAGTTVDFAITSGGGSVSPASAVTDANGQASTTLRLGTAAGINTVSASSAAAGSVEFTATGTVDPGSATQLVLTPASGSTAVLSPNAYQATLMDQFGNTVTGATNTVAFSVSGVSGTFNPNSPVTPTSGVAFVDFTPSSTGNATLTASATGLTNGTASLTVIDPTITKASGDNQSGTVGTVLADPLVVEVRDNSSNSPMAGVTVDFAVSGSGGAILPTSAVTDANGIASATLTLGTVVGSHVVTATAQDVGNVAFTATATVGAATQLALSPADTNTLVNTAVAYEATVQDQYGNTVTNAAGPISFSVGGVSGSFNPSAPVAPTGGKASVSFTAITAGGATITASANDLTDGLGSLTVAAGTISKASGDNQLGDPGTVLGEPLVVELRDETNAPMVGTVVDFVVTKGGGSITPASATTDATGRASAAFTLGPQGGQHTVAASALNVGSVAFAATTPNPIVLENRKSGTTDWQITNPVSSTSPEIAGYANATSVDLGESIALKVSLANPGSYAIDVYRLGHYAGLGGRLVTGTGTLNGITQPDCVVTDPTTFLVECNWSTSHNLQIGTDWTTGLYIANLTESATGKQSQIWFVVRDDSSTSDVLFQSSFTTFLAYNHYGDSAQHSLYGFNSTGQQRAYKVSFDRPFGQVTTDPSRYDNMLDYEHNMARWLESQGYDVSYVTNMDVHSDPGRLLQHKAFLSVGHDEYWSVEMRDAVEQARDSGVNLGFFSANTAYWRVRFEPSSTGEPNRVMACYKNPLANDPVAPTYRWRDAENNRPENALLGVMYTGDDVYGQYGGYDHVVVNSNDPYYNFTGLSDGDALSGLVGFEWDAVVDNGFTPNGLVVLSESVVDPKGVAPGLPPGTDITISNAVRYTASSGAKVFSTGSIQWMWGLDSTGINPSRDDVRAQQFAVNVLADMGAKPFTPDPSLVVP